MQDNVLNSPVKSKQPSEKQLPSPLTQSSKKKSTSLTIDDFKIKHKLGQGAYGDVFLVEKIADKTLYAMKQIQKKKLQKQRKQYQALIEKQILSVLKHVGIIKMRSAFQDKKILYFIIEYCQGGAFVQFIKLNVNKLTEQIRTHYVAQIVNILEYLHKNGITHRDIKPQNIMLSSTGHLKLIDFGTAEISKCTLISNSFKEKIQNMKKNAKIQEMKFQQEQQKLEEQEAQSPRKKQRRSTFVGTSYYISPQLIQDNYCPPQADLWALGCIIYQLYYYQTPFKDTYEFAVYEKIKKCQLQFPKNKQITQEAIDLIKKLLVKNPDQRLGSGKNQDLTYEKLKSHPYFKKFNINIDNIFQKQVPEISQLTEPELNDTIQQKQEKKENRQKTKTEFSKSMLQTLKVFQKQKKILIHGIVEKKTFIKYSDYYLVVFEDLTIQRTKAEEKDKKKILQIKIDLDQNLQNCLPAKFIDPSKFQLQTTQKKYSLKCQGDAMKWVQTINGQYKKIYLSKKKMKEHT